MTKREIVNRMLEMEQECDVLYKKMGNKWLMCYDEKRLMRQTKISLEYALECITASRDEIWEEYVATVQRKLDKINACMGSDYQVKSVITCDDIMREAKRELVKQICLMQEAAYEGFYDSEWDVDTLCEVYTGLKRAQEMVRKNEVLEEKLELLHTIEEISNFLNIPDYSSLYYSLNRLRTLHSAYRRILQVAAKMQEITLPKDGLFGDLEPISDKFHIENGKCECFAILDDECPILYVPNKESAQLHLAYYRNVIGVTHFKCKSVEIDEDRLHIGGL